jgi:hypothetical protein
LTPRAELVTPGSQRVRSYDPATGKLLWELRLGGGRYSASPVGDEERLYVGLGGGRGGRGGGAGSQNEAGGGRGSGGGGGALFAVTLGASGDLTPKPGEATSSGVAWSRPKGGPSMA